MTVTWTREVAMEEARCQPFKTGIYVEPNFGVGSPLAAQLSSPAPLLSS